MAIIIADEDLELAKVRMAQKSGSQLRQTIIQRPARKTAGPFDGGVDSDWTTWKMEVESYFRYFKAEFSNEEDRISWIERIYKNEALRWHQARVKALRS
jgi:hypothetical protein